MKLLCQGKADFGPAVCEVFKARQILLNADVTVLSKNAFNTHHHVDPQACCLSEFARSAVKHI